MVLAGALGFAIIAQVRQTSLEGLENLREDELVRIFAGVDQDGERLADEIRGLQSSLELLKSQSTNEAEAQRAARERLEALGILAGTVPATGPGIVLTISDPDNKVDAPTILDTVQELRDAGAEAIQINGERVVADTWFADTENGLSVSGVRGAPALRHRGDRRREHAGRRDGDPRRGHRHRPPGRRRHRRPDRGRGEGRRVADPDLASVRSARTHPHPLMGRPRPDQGAT